MTGWVIRTIGGDCEIAHESSGVRGDQFVEMRAADLFLALDEKGQGQRKIGKFFEQPGNRRHMHQLGPLVVGSSASIQAAAANDWIKRRRGPEFERIGGLHVVVSIHYYMGPFRVTAALGQNDRMQGGLN